MADVQKSAFSLSSATVMLAPAFGKDVFSLSPDLDSVGMVSEFSIMADSSQIELLSGVAQALVDSRKTNVRPAISGNVYEMTAQNFLRAAGFSRTATVVHRGVLSAAAAGAAVSLSINSDPIPGETTSAITVTGDIPSGSVILIQKANTPDYVFPTKSSGAATGSGPFVVPIAGVYAIPATMSFAAGDRVYVVDAIPVGNTTQDDLFSVKITGTLSNYDRPVTYVAPKVRITKGFQMAFNETQYTSMPWEMSPLLLSALEASSLSRGAEFGTKQPSLMFVGG